MRALIPAILATSFASPGLTQTCEGPVGPIETCVVGAWVGSSTIPEAMERMLRSMPDNVRANFSDFGRPVAMIIYEDGFFETFPMGADGNAVFQDEHGHVTHMEMNAQTISSAGYLSAMGGMLDICHLPGGEGGLTGQMTVTSEGGSATVPLAPPPGPQTFNPVITYTCAGDSLQQMVALPAPLGTIIYDLTRVPHSAFPEEMRARVRDLPAE